MEADQSHRPTLAELRHQLRTPLNHIMGYSEILIEETASGSPETRRLLTGIHSAARRVLESVQQILTPSVAPVTDADVRDLREKMQEPIQAIMRDVGLLIERGKSADLIDLLRISSAASELLSFALGQDAKATAAPAAADRDFQPGAMLNASVLLVDDNEGNRDILSRQLERVGCLVVTAEDGYSALRLIDAKPFDVVLLDVIMPPPDGMTTLQRISHRSEARPPVIMISALDEMDSVRRCLELGAEDYLLKPFDPVLLWSRLAATLERSRLRTAELERTRALEAALNQLQEINQDLQQFAYAASHDLQSPIRTVTAMSQLLARRYMGKLDSEADQLIENITGSMKRMSELVNDLLAYSRLSARNVEAPTEFPLSDSLNLALANLDEQIRSTDAVIIAERLPGVIGHRTQFVQLFQNLIGNSLKYRGAERPEIKVAVQYASEECIVQVSDNGIGFDAAYADQIFEPFKRLHGYEYPGSGIGLAICLRIVRQYGGRIWAESGKDSGAVFSFSIPSRMCQGQRANTA